MTYENSLSAIFARLREWSQLPKYALERRIDIFLVPFLAAYLADRMEAPVTLVAPEFPIKLVSSKAKVWDDWRIVTTLWDHVRDVAQPGKPVKLGPAAARKCYARASEGRVFCIELRKLRSNTLAADCVKPIAALLTDI